MGLYQGDCRVLIESLLYDPVWENLPPQERTIVIAEKARVFNVEFRPPSLRLLDCLGFFEIGNESGRKAFPPRISFPSLRRYQIPTSFPVEETLITLNKLLVLSSLSAKKSKTDNHVTQALLGDKFRLAYMLASFFSEFHSTCWLHESFHSNNIAFFHIPHSLESDGVSSNTSSVIHDPSIIGLNKSRPGGEVWHTQGPSGETDFLDYRNPAYQNTGHFGVGYDYHSLGSMLLEIGLWMPLAALTERREYRTLSPTELRDMLAARYVPRLGCNMGKTYQNVVCVLLFDGLDPNPEREIVDQTGESRALTKFLDENIEPLERLASKYF